MKREMLERKCDVCGRKKQHDKGEFATGRKFKGWCDLEIMGTVVEFVDLCSLPCLSKFVTDKLESEVSDHGR